MSNDIKSILLANDYLTMCELNKPSESSDEDNLPRKYLKYRVQKALVNSKKEKVGSFSHFRKVLSTLFF
jgi:hypothetical protein